MSYATYSQAAWWKIYYTFVYHLLLLLGKEYHLLLIFLFSTYTPLSLFCSGVLWKQTALFCQQTEWSYEGKCLIFFFWTLIYFFCHSFDYVAHAFVMKYIQTYILNVSRVKASRRRSWLGLWFHVVRWTSWKSEWSSRHSLENPSTKQSPLVCSDVCLLIQTNTDTDASVHLSFFS